MLLLSGASDEGWIAGLGAFAARERIGLDHIKVESGPFPIDNLVGSTLALAAQGGLPVAPETGLRDTEVRADIESRGLWIDWPRLPASAASTVASTPPGRRSSTATDDYEQQLEKTKV
jgi:hypothetical protein